MKKIIFNIFIMCLSQFVFAEKSNLDSLSLKIKLSYHYYQDGILKEFTVNQNLQAKYNHKWFAIPPNQSSDTQYFMFLSRIENLDNKSARIKFLLLNTNKLPHVISKPEMVMVYNHESAIQIQDKNDELKLRVLLTKDSK